MSNILTKTMSKKLSRRTFLKASAAATTLAALGDKLLGGPVSTLVEGVAGAATEDVWIPTFCYVCNRGPDNIKVHRVDGVAVGLEGNKDFEVESKSRGKVCPKAFGAIQKAYYPYRVKAPLKRTNPEKGFERDPVTNEILYDERGYPITVDPGWMEISWDVALDTVAGWLRDAIDWAEAHPGEYGNIGHPQAGGGSYRTLDGTFSTNFRVAMKNLGVLWDTSLEGGSGIRCTMAEHVFCKHIHGSGTGYVAVANINYVIHSRNFLAQSGAPGLAPEGAWADARRRGVKVVLLTPYAPVTMAYVDEWVPIKPRTETAFFMAMAHVMVHEIGLASLDVPFLKTLTNSPYLVGPGGYLLRDSVSKKPLVWDLVEGAARTYDYKNYNDPVIGDALALEGTYIASGVEVNGLGVEIVDVDVDAKPAYQVLKEHLLSYPPEWAEGICQIPAATIRRIANEFLTEARVGETIVLDGVTLPYRPAGINPSRGYNTGWASYQSIAAVHLCQMLIGALEVPGTHGGAGNATVTPGADGMPFVKMSSWQWPARTFGFKDSICPVTGNATNEALQSLAAWLILNEGTPLHNIPLPTKLGYFNHRCNPVMSLHDPRLQVEVIKKFPWAVAFAYITSETNEHCDILLPDNTDMETSHITSHGPSREGTYKWLGRIIRQRVVEPPFNSREMGDMCTELADRAGFLVAYNTSINAGLRTGQKLPDLTVKYPWDDGTDNCILGRICLSTVCRHDGTTHYHSLAEYKTTGGYFWRTEEWRGHNVHLEMVAKKLRYNIPYSEYVKKAGEELQFHLDEKGIDWWDTLDYTALPEWRSPDFFYEGGSEYDLHCLSLRSMQFAWANNVELPWMIDIADHTLGMAGVTMSADAAAARGISEGDEVWIESPIAKNKGKARLVQGLRPDCIVLTQQMGHYTTPVAKERGWPTLNVHIPVDPKWTEKLNGSVANLALVKVYKA